MKSAFDELNQKFIEIKENFLNDTFQAKIT